MVKVKLEGIEALNKVLKIKKSNAKKIPDVVRKHGAGLSDKTQSNMLKQYTGHYEWKKGRGKVLVHPTGATRRSAIVEITDSGHTATVAPNTKYFPYLEYGTRFMKARPTLKPAFMREAPLFKKDIEKLIKNDS